MEKRQIKFYAKGSNAAAIHALPGHFATSNSHINYYIDITSLKTRINEAKEVAKVLASRFTSHITVDTIVCMDGTEVIGAFLSEEMERRNILSTINQHKTVYVVSPEFNSNSQMIFRDNIKPAIAGKHVLLLLATTTTGATIQRALECVRYYGGNAVGVASVFSTLEKIEGFPIESVFEEDDIPGYAAYQPGNCPFCQKGHKLDAMVNGFGYSKL
ncbi:MAG: orotate phosphoribosyltransferase [Lachnospiraceae bacterium]|nr:orotate phosphoribosyltransferase [Lachnospiraceae bacterium]